MRGTIGIIGTGWVGSSVAISTLHMGLANRLLLCDVRREIAEGEALDLSHGASFYPSAKVEAVELEQMAQADAVVICAGRGGKPGESRLELLRENATIARGIGTVLASCQGLVVVVANPVDILTKVVAEASGLPHHRVVGTGTMLDTARLRQVLGRELKLDPRSIHAQVVGEHGDSEVVLWSGARVGGMPLSRWPGWDAARQPSLADEVRRAAQEIIRRKGATNHAIGLVTASLLRWAMRGERRILTISRIQDDVPGLEGIALSLPAVVGSDGARQVIQPDMNDGEREGLLRSAEVLRTAAADIGW